MIYGMKTIIYIFRSDIYPICTVMTNIHVYVYRVIRADKIQS